MINEKRILDASQTIASDLTEIDKSMIEFQRTWVIWENYTPKEGVLEYKDST